MDIEELDRRAKNRTGERSKLTLQERAYYVAMRGLYSQYRTGEISLEQAEHDKEVVVDAYEAYLGKGNAGKQIIHLNKKQVVEAVILELGRYISCASTNRDRDMSYPRKLFEKRIVQMIDKAYEGDVQCGN